MSVQTDDALPLLDAMLNMTAFHREHENFYSSSPREQAVTLQRHSRTLHALADRWMVIDTGHASFVEDAVHPVLFYDVDGKVPMGETDYVLHFDADELPPCDAFWSVTMYDGFPVPNDLDRYALGDRDPLVYNPDGSLDLYLRRGDPGDARRPNWLPTPAGPFGVTLRLYDPRPEVLDGTWTPPPLTPAPSDDRASPPTPGRPGRRVNVNHARRT